MSVRFGSHFQLRYRHSVSPEQAKARTVETLRFVKHGLGTRAGSSGKQPGELCNFKTVLINPPDKFIVFANANGLDIACPDRFDKQMETALTSFVKQSVDSNASCDYVRLETGIETDVQVEQIADELKLRYAQAKLNELKPEQPLSQSAE
jgi:hypothetical protein